MNYIVKEGVEAYSTINNVRNNQDKQKSINRAASIEGIADFTRTRT